MHILGVDVGITGALALVRDDASIIRVQDMPTVALKIGRTTRNRINVAGLAADIRLLKPDHVAIERVGGLPHDAASFAFNFGFAAGLLEGVVATLGIPYTYVAPQVWRKAMGVSCPPGSTHADRKEASRQRSLQLWPDRAALFARRLDNGRAEAALIARWFCLAQGLMQERAAA